MLKRNIVFNKHSNSINSIKYIYYIAVNPLYKVEDVSFMKRTPSIVKFARSEKATA